MLPSCSAADRRGALAAPPDRRRCGPTGTGLDNEGAAGSWPSGVPKLTDELAALASLLGVKCVLCKPREEAKGLVERANGYIETSFLPRRVFTSPADFKRTQRSITSLSGPEIA